MKLSLILSFYTTSVLSKQLPSHNVAHNLGSCQTLRDGPDSLLSQPVCSSQLLDHNLPSPTQNTTRHDTNHIWDKTTSCIKNGTTDFCGFTSSDFGDGRGITVLTTPERSTYFATLLSFTDNDILRHANKEVNAHKYQMVHVPGKDVGVVATQPFHRGDHIMTFTPSIMIDYAVYETLSSEDTRRMQAEAIDSLPFNLRSTFMNLSTHDGASTHVEKIDKILRTNAFDVDLLDDVDFGFYVVFPEISRFNHDCRPNADYYFDPETLEQHIHAIRPIAVGEEISLSYMDPVKPRAKRVKKAQQIWGFQCGCSACTQRNDMILASDARIAQINDLREHLADYSSDSAATPQMAELFVSLYEQERLHSSIYEAYTFAAIEWNGAGEPWTAVKYARLAIEFGLATVGPRDGDVMEMETLVADPWGHWSWMSRTSKRLGWNKMRIGGRDNYMRGGDVE